MANEELKNFKLTIELEKRFRDELTENEVHFRANIHSLSLISISQAKPELGVTCKNHPDWTSEILRSYIKQVKQLPEPKRYTPEKTLQAWIIKAAQKNNGNLPFSDSIKLITSELALSNDRGTKTVADIIGFDVRSDQLVIIELKSERQLKRLIEQVDNFEKIIQDNYTFFENLVALHGFNSMDSEIRKAIVWPHRRTSPLAELKDENIDEFTYREDICDSYEFFDHSKVRLQTTPLPVEFDIGADFYSFRQEIIEEYGKQNREQAYLFFDRAVALAEKDFLHSAISDAEVALTFSQLSNEYGNIYIVGLLSELHLNANNISQAKAYCDAGIKMLDEDNPDYCQDRESFEELRDRIDGEDWKGSITGH